jgi:hypothetical protein
LFVLGLSGVSSEALSPQNASYQIEVSLDDEAKLLDGKLVLTWRNIQQAPTDELWFHLYWNAWRNDQTTWLRERRIARGEPVEDVQEGEWSYIEIESMTLLSSGDHPESDLLERMSYTSPDDGNPEDRTVMVVSLPRAVEPGETIEVQLSWRGKLPRQFARTGYRGAYSFFGQWFPKLGVYEEDGWNCHQFHNQTEFYSDYGVYDVSMTVPDYLVLGATGVETERRENGDGTVTHRYQQADVHDFAWTVSPHYLDQTAMFAEPGLPVVRMRLLLQPERHDQGERYFDAVRACLTYFGKWFGPYPYEQITIIDPPLETNTGGMEYPTLFTGASRLFNPDESHSPAGVTVHECGHQFWYALVGSNEFEHAWLDEGLNSYSAERTMDVAYGDRSWVERYLAIPGTDGALPMILDGIFKPRTVSRLDQYRSAAFSDDQEIPTYLYHAPEAHRTTYSKTMLWLGTLERYLGWETFQQGLAAYFEQYRFAHPGPEDLFSAIETASGQELDWFFDQVYRSTVTFDYKVDWVDSYSTETTGLVEQDGEHVFHEPEADDEGPYRTEVVVTRMGDGRFPVDLLMVFEDGHEIRQSWDGQAHWQGFSVEYAEKLAYAVIDPERILLLDLYPSNNSLLREPEATPAARKWTAYWMLWVQDMLNTFSFFV